MSKGLEAFYDLIKNQTITDEIIIIEKELKVLEILKKYLRYYESWYENQAQYDYEHIHLRMENSPFVDDEEVEDLIKVKEWLNNEYK